MDTFFQQLRDIQKKERTTGTLSEVDDSFYTDASNYLQELLKMVDKNPLSLEAYQLRDAQLIITEICERREFKIVSTAATNVQKAHDLFKGHKKDSELYDVIPFNTTPEEEEFYRKVVDMMVGYREELMDKIILNKRSEKTKIGFRPKRKEEQIEESAQSQDSDVEESTKKQKDEVPDEKEETSGIKSSPILDEDQIAMMFGQAPDEVLLDENNNPVKEVKTDISTPFKAPPTPKEDTITLQNIDSETVAAEDDDVEDTEEIPDVKEDIPEGDDYVEEDVALQEDTTLQDDDAVEELVMFKDEIMNDILDENEKTYGPFLTGDVVLLPKSLVNILSRKDMVRIIR